eukprot:s8307_g1.t1
MRLQPSLLSPPSDPEEREKKKGAKKKKEQKKTAPVAVCIELDTTRNCSRDRVLAKRCTAESIQRKSGVDLSSIPETCLEVKHASERDLALKLLQFPEVIEVILADLHLHHLTDYLWELCNTLTAFYMKCKVLGEAAQSSRLLLCEATRKVLLKSFQLLGFTPLDRI